MATAPPDPVLAIVAAELAGPVDPRAAAMAARIAAEFGDAARAVLFYGSCLREAVLDGLMLDFYVIVSDYRAAYRGRWLPLANRLLPPNVFPFSHDGLAAKYAVLSEVDFDRLSGRQAPDPSVFARFAQPAQIAWSRDDIARDRAARAVARSVRTLLAFARPLAPAARGAELWRTAFALTYQTELRAERKGRGDAIVGSDPDRYDRLAAAAGADADSVPAAAARRRWARWRRRGKWLTLARLAKATTTFAGGIDYLAWKVGRHAQVPITIRPWQRRWPILGALTLLPRLFASGAVR